MCRIYDVNISNPTTSNSTLSAGKPNSGNSEIGSPKGRVCYNSNCLWKRSADVDTMTEALPALGIAALIAVVVAAVGGYFLYRWMNRRRAMNNIASTT